MNFLLFRFFAVSGDGDTGPPFSETFGFAVRRSGIPMGSGNRRGRFLLQPRCLCSGIPFRRTVFLETRHKKTGLPAGLPLSD